mgnify:FL=1
MIKIDIAVFLNFSKKNRFYFNNTEIFFFNSFNIIKNADNSFKNLHLFLYNFKINFSYFFYNFLNNSFYLFIFIFNFIFNFFFFF